MRALLLAIFIFNSCSYMNLKYDAQIKTKRGDVKQFSHNGLFEVGGLKTWCWITGVFYGGACWAYLALPFDKKEKQMIGVSRMTMDDIYGANNYTVVTEEVSRESWDSPTYITVPYKGIQGKRAYWTKCGHKAICIMEADKYCPEGYQMVDDKKETSVQSSAYVDKNFGTANAFTSHSTELTYACN